MRILLAAAALWLMGTAPAAQAADVEANRAPDVTRPVILALPGMDRVKVSDEIDYAAATAESHVRMQVYRPPGLKPKDRRGAVIVVHGGVASEVAPHRWTAIQSFGRLVAASGMVGVTFTHRMGWPNVRMAQAAQDVATAIAYVRTHADTLNVDPDRLCVTVFSAGGPLMTPYLVGALPEIRCVVGIDTVMDTAAWAPDPESQIARTLAPFSPIGRLAAPGRKTPLYLVRAGADSAPLLQAMDRFAAEALKTDYPLTLANNPGAPHAFAIAEPTPRGVEVLAEALAFMRRHLEK